MKATQFVVLLCAGIASAAKCKPALPSSTSSAASSVSASASASASAAPSSSSASVSASKSASSFGSSSSPAVSASASAAASSVSASSVSVSASVSASASLSSASASSASSVASSVVASSASASASAPATSATCGPASANLLGANANFATNSGSWITNVGTGTLESASCEATTNQCIEFVTTANNNLVLGTYLTTVVGKSYTVTFDYSLISGTAASDSIVCTAGGSTTVSKTLDLTATGFTAVTLDFNAATASTSFFCSGTTVGATTIAFNNFKQTLDC